MSFTKLSPLGFITREELTVWRDRAVNGPFKSGTNPKYAQGQWDHLIVADKNVFMNNPEAALYAGPSSWEGSKTGCTGESTAGGKAPMLEKADRINAAAFFAVVQGDTAHGKAVADEAARILHKQVNYQDTKFCNTSRFCNNNVQTQDLMLGFHSDWICGLAMAYESLVAHEADQNRTVLTATQKNNILNWMECFTRWINGNLGYLTTDLASNWGSHDGADGTGWNLTSKATGGGRQGVLYDKGPNTQLVGERINNRSMRAARALGMLGLLVGNTGYVNTAKKLVRFALMYGYVPSFTDGTTGKKIGSGYDFYRWGKVYDDNWRTKGWKYAQETTAVMVTIAEALWRANGDASLLNFSTTAGSGVTSGSRPGGSPKTLASLIRDMDLYVTKDVRVTVGGRTMDAGAWRAHDLMTMHINRHAKDPKIEQCYMRSGGSYAFQTDQKVIGGKIKMGSGDSGVFPAARFMFGLMEDVFEGTSTGTAPETPVLTPAGGTFETAQSVSATSAGSTSIRYTRGPLGTTFAAPDDAGTTGTLYSGPITNVSDETVKVRGYNADGASPVGRGDYDVVALPGAATITPNGGTFESAVDAAVSAPDADEMIFTLDGSTPTASNGTRVAVGFGVTVAQTSTLKTRGINASGVGTVASADFVIGTQPPPPTILLDGAAVSGSVSKSGPGTLTAAHPVGYETAELRYTMVSSLTNPPDPTSSSPLMPSGGIRIGGPTGFEVSTHVPDTAAITVFATPGYFTAPIPTSPVLDANNASIISELNSAAGNTNRVLNTYAYGVPIYEVLASQRAGTPKYAISPSQWGRAGTDVPIPDTAAPSVGTDGAMCVIDWGHPDGARVWDFWQAAKSGGVWTCSSFDWSDLSGAGNNNVTTGAGLSRLAGVARIPETVNGDIRHALVFSTTKARNTFREPATKTDGANTGTQFIPEGARLQLDPGIDADAKPWPEYAKTVARCLQRYGAYCVDNGGSRVALIAEGDSQRVAGNPPTSPGNPSAVGGEYRDVGVTTDDYADLSMIPWGQMRVLARWDGA